jgi:hypothetical protein
MNTQHSCYPKENFISCQDAIISASRQYFDCVQNQVIANIKNKFNMDLILLSITQLDAYRKHGIIEYHTADIYSNIVSVLRLYMKDLKDNMKDYITNKTCILDEFRSTYDALYQAYCFQNGNNIFTAEELADIHQSIKSVIHSTAILLKDRTSIYHEAFASNINFIKICLTVCNKSTFPEEYARPIADSISYIEEIDQFAYKLETVQPNMESWEVVTNRNEVGDCAMDIVGFEFQNHDYDIDKSLPVIANDLSVASLTPPDVATCSNLSNQLFAIGFDSPSNNEMLEESSMDTWIDSGNNDSENHKSNEDSVIPMDVGTENTSGIKRKNEKFKKIKNKNKHLKSGKKSFPSSITMPLPDNKSAQLKKNKNCDQDLLVHQSKSDETPNILSYHSLESPPDSLKVPCYALPDVLSNINSMIDKNDIITNANIEIPKDMTSLNLMKNYIIDSELSIINHHDSFWQVVVDIASAVDLKYVDIHIHGAAISEYFV